MPVALPTTGPWPGHGRAMARIWPGHGPAMARQWPNHVPAMARTWPGHGPAMARPWECCWTGACVYSMTFILPPILVLATTAAALFNGLYHHPLNNKMWTALMYIAGRAGFTICLSESDAASSNVKLGAFQSSMASAKVSSLVSVLAASHHPNNGSNRECYETSGSASSPVVGVPAG